MKAKAISFTPDVLKAKLRALEQYGTCQTRRPLGWALPTDPRDVPHARWGIVDGAFWFAGLKSPFGPPGQRLWARERARVVERDCPIVEDGATEDARWRIRVRYAADGVESDWLEWPRRLEWWPVVGRCIPNGVHREGARHFLEVVEVRADRVSEISEQDALLEGMEPVVHEHWSAYDPETDGYPSFGVEPDAEMIAQRRLENVRHHRPKVISSARDQFLSVYDSIYGLGSHAKDWCWVYTLKRATP